MNRNCVEGCAVAGILRGLKGVPDDHFEIHRRVVEELSEADFEVRKFVDVTYWRGKRNGRIDVVATRNGGTVAIELNNRRLKPISAPKLRAISAYRIIVSRQVEFVKMPVGVDENVVLKVL